MSIHPAAYGCFRMAQRNSRAVKSHRYSPPGMRISLSENREAAPRSALPELFLQVAERLLAAVAIQVLLQPRKRDSNHVAMVQAGAEGLLEPKPELVHAVQILGP